MSINKYRRSFVNSTAIILLSLLFIVFTDRARAEPQAKHRKKTVTNQMTVIEVSGPQAGETFYSVIFQVSQRQYKLPADANPKYLKLLRASGKNHTPVLIERAREESDVILRVRKVADSSKTPHK